MKRILLFVLCIVICSFCFAFANDTDVPDEPYSITNDPNIVYQGSNITPLLQEIADTLKETKLNGDVIIEPYENTSFQQLRISASDTSGLHAILLSLIGDYNPIVKDYTYQSSNGYANHSIEIQPDWSWILSCALFIVVIFSVFHLFGVVLKRG